MDYYRISGATDIKIMDIDLSNEEVVSNLLAREEERCSDFFESARLVSIDQASLYLNIDDSTADGNPLTGSCYTVDAENIFVRMLGRNSSGEARLAIISISEKEMMKLFA